jgi:hypothetical protein
LNVFLEARQLSWTSDNVIKGFLMPDTPREPDILLIWFAENDFRE